MTEDIYSIRDEYGAVHYIGRTMQTLYRRMAGHVSDAKLGKTEIGSWIAAYQGKPTIQLEQQLPAYSADAGRVERSWIEKYRAEGHPIKNKWPKPLKSFLIKPLEQALTELEKPNA